jgi:hypothetical protein
MPAITDHKYNIGSKTAADITYMQPTPDILYQRGWMKEVTATEDMMHCFPPSVGQGACGLAAMLVSEHSVKCHRLVKLDL